MCVRCVSLVRGCRRLVFLIGKKRWILMNVTDRKVHKFGKRIGWRWCLRRREGWHRWRQSGARLHVGPKRCMQLVSASFYDDSLGAIRCLKTGVILHYTLTQNIGTHTAYMPFSLNPLLLSSEFLTSQLWLGNIHLSWDVAINRIRLDGLICSLKSFSQLNMCQELQNFAAVHMYSGAS